jgi:hypothetical protein
MTRCLLAVALVGAVAASAASAALGAVASKVCWPGYTIPAVHLPATHLPGGTLPGGTLPGGTIPGGCFAGNCYPAIKVAPIHVAPVHFSPVDIPAVTIPAVHVPRRCFDANAALRPAQTTVRVSGYSAIDPSFSPTLSNRYWQNAGVTVSIPDVTAAGFGGFNAAGFPKNQYVRPYLRSNGTYVSGYWRNSPTDGLPTCKIISC